MKITIGKLRSLIRESMVSELPEGVKVIIEEEGRTLAVYVAEEGKPKAHWPGWIKLQRVQVPDGNIWEVVNSAANKGYGPLLYDLAMEIVVGEIGDLGVTCDTTSVSPEAQRVWDFYYSSRNDVEHEELPPNFFGAKDRPESLRYYYYKIGTPRLDYLTELGKVERR